MTFQTGDENPDLFRLFAGGEPEEVSGYLYVPRKGVPLATGSAARLLVPNYSARPSALIVPSSVRPTQPIDFIKTFVTLDEYLLPPGEMTPDQIALVVETFARAGTLRQRLTDLAILNHLVAQRGAMPDVGAEYGTYLVPEAAERLTNALRPTPNDSERYLLSRQGVLRALYQASAHLDDADDVVEPTRVGTIALIHAVSSHLFEPVRLQGDTVTEQGVPTPLTMEVIQSELFHRTDEPLSIMNRYFQVWTAYGSELQRVELREKPDDLLREATGLNVVDWMAFGFGLWMHVLQWEMDQGFWVAPTRFSRSDQGKLESFLRAVSLDSPALAECARAAAGPWDFLSLQRRPLVHHGGDYLIVDETFLLERFTAGLYWEVHDFEKSLSEHQRHVWTQAYGEMLESYVVDRLESLAPPILGGGKSFYTESDFKSAYGGKVCDAGIDYGRCFLAVEVVSGQVQVGARIVGDPEAFERDTDRLIMKKAGQLNDITASLLEDMEPLVGASAGTGTQIIPVLVNAGTYPVNPASMAYVEERLRELELLQDPRLTQLCVIDVSEIELLEGLAEQGGPSMDEVLAAWKKSDLANIALKNYALSEHEVRRPSRVARESSELFDLIIDRLGVRDGHGPDGSA